MEDLISVDLLVNGMTCTSCADTITTYLSKINGIKNVSINYSTKTARILYYSTMVNEETIIKNIDHIGFGVKKNLQNIDGPGLFWNKLLISSFISILILGLNLFHHFIHSSIYFINFMSFILTTISYLFVGKSIYYFAYIGIINHRMNMDFLISMGLTFSFIHSIIQMAMNEHTFFDSSAMLISLTIIGKYLKEFANKKMIESVSKLISLKKNTATVCKNYGPYMEETDLDIGLVGIDDIVKVIPGDAIPVDGIIVGGSSTVDESMVTGEPMPISKKIGDNVIGGTINRKDLLFVKTTRKDSDSTLTQIINLVKDAQFNKASIQSYTDHLLQYFIPSVLIISAATSIFLYFILEESFINSIITATNIIIIACPCSLALATPTAIMVGLGMAAENGILIRNTHSIGIASKIDSIVFDKTGILTDKSDNIKIKIVNDNIKETDLLFYLGSAESASKHPIARTIVNYTKNYDRFRLVKPLVPPQNFRVVDGKGIVCNINDKKITIGNYKFSETMATTGVEIFEGLLYLWIDDDLCATIEICDNIKPEAGILVDTLQNKFDINCMIASGDVATSVQMVANKLGINNFTGDMLPHEKSKKIMELKNNGRMVAMVGDGINDSPALASADIGISIGSASDLAINSADIILIRNNLLDILKFIDLSKKIMGKIKFNYFCAFFYNIITIPMATGLFGFRINPSIACVSMIFSSLTVVISSLMLRYKDYSEYRK